MKSETDCQIFFSGYFSFWHNITAFNSVNILALVFGCALPNRLFHQSEKERSQLSLTMIQKLVIRAGGWTDRQPEYEE